MKAPTDQLLGFAKTLAQSTKASAVVVYADAFGDPADACRFARPVDNGLRVVLATRSRETFDALVESNATALLVPDIRLTRMGQIKMAVLIGFSRKVFKHGDQLVCLSGIAESGVLDTMVFMEVNDEFELFAPTETDKLTRNVRSEVFERVLDIAVALGNRGREGKPVGTIFVVGDSENVLEHSVQMILNPFQGYSQKQRNILDKSLENTIRELSTIDGAFVITGDGFVETAGAYLKPVTAVAGLPRGLGARHHSAAGITADTEATSITVSETTGAVTFFRKGKIIIEIEAPRRIGPRTPRTDEFFEKSPATGGTEGEMSE